MPVDGEKKKASRCVQSTCGEFLHISPVVGLNWRRSERPCVRVTVVVIEANLILIHHVVVEELQQDGAVSQPECHRLQMRHTYSSRGTAGVNAEGESREAVVAEVWLA